MPTGHGNLDINYIIWEILAVLSTTVKEKDLGITIIKY